MISADCSFKEFISAIEGSDYYDIMTKVEQEATEAERCSYRGKVSSNDKEQCGKYYAATLKNFLSYLRFGIKHRGIREDHFQLFMAVGQTLQSDNRFPTRATSSHYTR
jgi:hypothetical protein